MREPAIKIEPRPVLLVGQKVRFDRTKTAWTVRAVTKAGRFVILTQPFNLQRTVSYTVIDFDRGVRGVDNYYGMGYTNHEEIADALHEFQHTEDDDLERALACDQQCRHGAEVSHRNHIRLDFKAIGDQLTDWAGRAL